MSSPPRDGIRRKPREAILPDGTRMTYNEYIRSDAWQEKREAFRRSKLKKKCFCGERQVDLHHRSYKNLGNERLMDLVPLCRKHHILTHEQIARSEKLRTGIWGVHKKIQKKWTSNKKREIKLARVKRRREKRLREWEARQEQE